MANKEDKHGFTTKLSDPERQQLVAYLQQLDDEGEVAGISKRKTGAAQVTSARYQTKLKGYNALGAKRPQRHPSIFISH